MAIGIAGLTFEGPFQTVASLRHEQGIYVIIDRRDDGARYGVDCGESIDVHARVQCHDRAGCWVARCLGTLEAAVLYTGGRDDRERWVIEQHVRHLIPFPCGNN